MDLSKLQNGSDVRGVALAGVENEPVTLDDAAVRAIAGGFARFLRARLGKESCRVSVGRDSRLSGGAIAETLCETLAACGTEVTDLGLCTTPAMFMTTVTGESPFDAAVMITASHLPWNRNGLKFFTAAGGAESADVREILRLAAEETPLAPGGSVAQGEFMETYAAILREKIIAAANGNEKPLAGKHIVVDAGNGAGGFFAECVLAPLGADTTGSRYLDPDGHFPNHVPNPELPEAMDSIREAVLESHADFGVIFDTDVDRAGAVLSNGEELNRNRLIALISVILLSEKAGTVVTDSVTSDGLAEFIAAHGGKHRRFKRGYKNVINEAIRLNAAGEYTPLAIETSGHAALKENYFLDDGAYLITRLLIALAKAAKQGKNLSDLIADLKMPAEAAELRFKFKPDCDFKTLGANLIERLKEYSATKPYITPAKDNHEGVRLNFDKAHGAGWLLVRMSLHEPILPTNAESEEKGGVKKIVSELYAFLKEFDFLDLSPAENYLKQ